MAKAPRNSSSNAQDTDALLKMYALLVEMSDRVSQRRQAANSFYLSVNTALISASAFLTSTPARNVLWVLGIAGIAICALWVRNIDSYRTLNAAKFKVIHDLEARLPAQPYTDEWGHLAPSDSGKRHTAFHKIEGRVPFVFIAVHATQAMYGIPWATLRNLLCSG